MTAKSYAIAEPRVISRASVHDGGVTEIVFEVRAHSVTYLTRSRAIRAWMEGLDRDLVGAPDEHIARHWRVEVRNGRARCVRVQRRTS